QVAGLAFWIFFLLSAVLAQSWTQWPNFAQEVLGESGIETLEENFAHPPVDGSLEDNQAMAGFYIQHNTGIGLQCFAHGLLVIPGLLVNIYNAVVLGASFGYMWRPEVSQGANFFEFVTAHGPFELTAIVLSSGAGLRLGISWMWTNGLTRSDSLQQNARQSMPLMGAAIVMFFMAALIEGFVSPSPLPYFVKASIAAISSGILMFYFVVLGFPRR
ncbi:MAG: stage II sporulation protein M, partial [Planctomycetales bacterium]|nr:stage II sporulation protein M [Planctomycetales bacterium]